MRHAVPAALVLALALAAGPAAAPGTAVADTFELADGTVVDGRVTQEKDGFVWIRTLLDVRKVAASDIRSRAEGVPDFERYAALRAKIDKDPRDVASMWDLYQLLLKYAEQSKPHAAEARLLPPRIVKVAPDHEGARDANGEVKFEGVWVRKEDLARLQAEAERRRKTVEWQTKLGVQVELYDCDHWLLVDNTKSKELSKHAKALDEIYRLCGETLGADRFWDGQAPVVTLAKFSDYTRILDESWKGWGISQWRYEAARNPQNCGIWLHRPTQYQMRAVPEAKSDAEDGMWAAVVHNAVHVAIWSQRRASEPPAWFEEGLASLLEIETRGYQKAFCVGVQADSRQKTSDQPKKGKGGNKALAGEQQVFKEHAKRAMEDGEFPEMRKFLTMKLGDFGPAEVGGAMGLVQWLRGKDPEKFKQLWAEIRAGVPAKDQDAPWRKVYGWNLIEDMQKDFKVWVLAEW
jgi:hypothetical protein